MRVASLDVAKGIGIFLMVLGHNNLLKANAPELFAAMSTFRVPLFFMLSGAFLPELVTKSFVRLRFGIFFWPFLIGILLALPLQLLDLSHPANDGFPLGVLWATGNSVMNAPLWFLSNLIVATCFILVLDELGSPPSLDSYLGFALFALGMWLVSMPEIVSHLPKDKLGRIWGLPWSLDIGLVSAGLMMAGRGMGSRLKMPWQGRAKEVSLLIGFSAIFLLTFYTGSPALDLNNRVAVNIGPLLFCALSGIGMMISLSRCLVRFEGPWIDIVRRFGTASLVVLICHWPLQQVFMRILKRLGHNIEADFLISILTCVLIYFFAERVVAPRPLLQKLLTGR